jgi:hypothetical protein
MASCRPFIGPGHDDVGEQQADREHVPGLPIVAISGMTALDFVADMPGLADVVCLQKPFRPNELMAAIEAARSVSPVS